MAIARPPQEQKRWDTTWFWAVMMVLALVPLAVIFFAPANYYAVVSVSPAPVVTSAVCASMVRMVEDAAARQGGFATARHESYPTTDLSVLDDPALLAFWKDQVV